eukprot:1144631-Pelagomonas_calceolata.AAC.2
MPCEQAPGRPKKCEAEKIQKHSRVTERIVLVLGAQPDWGIQGCSELTLAPFLKERKLLPSCTCLRAA